MSRKVTAIPATKNLYTKTSKVSTAKRKVAGYARVSTDHEDQQTSYEAQIDYYTNYIKNRSDWEFVKVYTDEGISATSTKNRDGFKSMIDDALAGKIDLIITKSVSRFARNTVDSLSTIRLLKEHSVEVYFEKENIWTFDSKGELLITIMSSLAQEESRSISENCTWGQRKRMQDGRVSIPYSMFLGYEKGPAGTIVINEEEAKLVRRIYALFLQGYTTHGIARILNDENIPTIHGGKMWRHGVIKHILTNEKYKGDALMQQEYTVDFLTKKRSKNNGELPMYYVENSHPAIIPQRTFNLVQELMKRRQEGYAKYNNVSPISGTLKCSRCGAYYGSKVWASNTTHRKVVWHCNNKYNRKLAREDRCKTHKIDEDQIQRMFVQALNELIGNKDKVIQEQHEIWGEVFNTSELEEMESVLTVQVERLYKDIENLIASNIDGSWNEDEFEMVYNDLNEQYQAAKDDLEEVTEQINATKAEETKVDFFLDDLTKQPILSEYSPTAYMTFVEEVMIYDRERADFKFKNGTTVSVPIPPMKRKPRAKKGNS